MDRHFTCGTIRTKQNVEHTSNHGGPITWTHTQPYTHTYQVAITAHGPDMQVVKRQVQLTLYVCVCLLVTEVTTTTKH